MEKYDATRRINHQFEQKFNLLDMVFNKVDAFKKAVNTVKQ